MTDPVVIRDAVETDIPVVLEMNQSAVPNVNSVTDSFLDWCLEVAPYFRVAELDHRMAGFLVGLGPSLEYDSDNYTWFSSRYRDFLYIDRIVVGNWARGKGVGRALYEDIAGFAEAPVLLCEVNVRPRNDVSLKFHESFGFEEVGTQDTEGGAKTVKLLAKKLL